VADISVADISYHEKDALSRPFARASQWQRIDRGPVARLADVSADGRRVAFRTGGWEEGAIQLLERERIGIPAFPVVYS